MRLPRFIGMGRCCAVLSAVAALPAPGVGHAAMRGPVVEVVQTSADLAQRLAPEPALRFGFGHARVARVIRINDRVTYQRITGVGGAMTDSAAWLIHQRLGPAARAGLMRALYGTRGIRLDFTLIPMAASDFTVGGRPYSYDDVARGRSDSTLAHFSIAHDERYIVPVLHQMLALNPRVQTLATPWTAPPWMKTNDAYGDPNFGGELKRSAWAPFARYLVRCIEAYGRHGIPIDAIAPVNEPRSPAPYPAMDFPEHEEAAWLTGDLGPALETAGLRTRVYGADTSFSAPAYATGLVRSTARRVLAGIAEHCYHGSPAVLDRLHALDPALDLVVSECANQLTPYPVPEVVIGAMRHWAGTVALWNLALDPQGGPVQQPNVGCLLC